LRPPKYCFVASPECGCAEKKNITAIQPITHAQLNNLFDIVFGSNRVDSALGCVFESNKLIMLSKRFVLILTHPDDF
jgi:hypothetical protein